MKHSYIAVDWGSTNLRAWRVQDGVCIDHLQSACGITRLGGATPHAVFQRVLSPWLHLQALPVVMAGMVGSNAGWIEAPYLPCPASLDALAGQLQPVTEAWPVKAWIVPGLSVNRHENHNVMRGEETQLLGAYRERPAPYYVLPGTHSKWAQLDGARVLDFRTVMTGELHHLLLSQSLIGAGLPAQRAAPEWFQRGLQSGLTDRNILRALFETRGARVLGQLPPTAVGEWLSGLLIGNEVGGMLAQWAIPAGACISVIGNRNLNTRYLQAFALAGIDAHALDGDIAFQNGIRSLLHEQ
ncbi:2-dehydro-3-deoxygalactonokinase [Silvimonas sp. JCM 19000]